MDLSDAVLDQDTCENFVVLRSQGGQFTAGGWTEGQPTSLAGFGVISIATPREVDALPEGDRIHGAIVINCTTPLFVTHASGQNGPGTSDIVIWKNEQYRVMRAHNYSTRGYFWSIAVRMAGS